jgi:hypothetical protein
MLPSLTLKRAAFLASIGMCLTCGRAVYYFLNTIIRSHSSLGFQSSYDPTSILVGWSVLAAMTAFVIFFYRDVPSPTSSHSLRRAALCAAITTVASLALMVYGYLSSAHWLSRQTPVGYLRWFFFSVLPEVAWAVLFILFWKEPAALGRRSTRLVALITAMLIAARGFHGEYIYVQSLVADWHSTRLWLLWDRHPLAALWDRVVLPGMVLFWWVTLVLLLVAMWMVRPTEAVTHPA